MLHRNKWDVNDQRDHREGESEGRGEKEQQELGGLMMWRIRGHYYCLFVRLKWGEITGFLAKE